uniref:Gfo/Idh/MocA-like oxidoreductase N-terminal domain-containing protein n=1 Tax=Grammatophora oceanica TaxID=210454 RepID=A0A7S1Y3R9_9STRA|mmetsp:Transcript_22313/g.33221  ORF Transcript_22313/g.33221 Transcript_22313/m.33221 type:complete len:381 (+) Transcript_22313:125-1267(+)|eukprot:CAMPEP_0194033882 /NCGR_PEP_ID=MMETSP0009_2-20130614/6378_1 /TAXON_ID=210454 /ORGANISM="Grammatophora oceanica, Strain CCMP 410" /LENGTH=380 /DNA_ID=CAMNT_0038674613 /DNA_START=46 /DNA_END=1188 /DNA_ORIENTATION=+
MSSSSNDDASYCAVVLVGCGAPLKSMGWYHAEQLLANKCAGAKLQYVVEPWYMNPASKGTPGYSEFQEWKTTQETTNGIQFYQHVSDVPTASEKEDDSKVRKLMAIISARTADNPKLFQECLKINCHTIFLEKPGAPSVGELESMRDAAKEAGTMVYMGFNKNVSSYVQRTRDLAAATTQGDEESCNVTFLHNNSYKQEELPECFERCAEGMLKNMAIHELAILATFYNVSVDTIATVQADADYSSCQTLTGPSSGKPFTDFDKLKFQITTKAGVSINVAADRCGGDDSVGIVESEKEGLARFTMPDETTVANIPTLEAEFPGAMPYFFTQDPDYREIKERVAQSCLSGEPATGVATMDIGIESLKLAEYLTPLLQEQLL